MAHPFWIKKSLPEGVTFTRNLHANKKLSIDSALFRKEKIQTKILSLLNLEMA